MARRADGEALLRQRRRDAVGVRSAEGVTFDRAPLLASIAVRTARTLFGEALARHALDPRAGPAMAMPGRELGYPELHRAVDACAAWLFGHGCAASEVVGITIADEYLHTVASLALLALGVPQVCLPTRDPAAMRLGLAQRIGVARVVVADPTHALERRRCR